MSKATCGGAAHHQTRMSLRSSGLRLLLGYEPVDEFHENSIASGDEQNRESGKWARR